MYYMYYFTGIVTLIGLLLPLVLHFKLKRLIRAAEHPGKSEHPLIKVMLNKFTACYKVQVGVNNVDNFVDKYVYTYKIGGFYLFTWDKLCGQPAWILLYGCFIQVIVDYLYFGGQLTDLSTIGLAVAASGLLMLYNHLFDRMDKLRVFGKEMADYLENSLGAKLEQEYLSTERPRTAARKRALEGQSGQEGLPLMADGEENDFLQEAQTKRKLGRMGQKKRAAESWKEAEGQEDETRKKRVKRQRAAERQKDGRGADSARETESAREAGLYAADRQNMDGSGQENDGQETGGGQREFTGGRNGEHRFRREQSGSVLAALSDQEMEALLGELAASVSGRSGLGKDQEIIDEILKEYLS